MKHIKEKMVRRTKMYTHEGKREKGLCQKNHIFFGFCLAAVFFVLLFVGIGVASATVTYDGTKILISGGEEDLTTILNALNDSNLLEQLSPKEWLLKVPIRIYSTGTLYINGSDCRWLKLLSLNDGNEAYIQNEGIVEINNTKITSWNTGTNAPAPKTDSTRSYINSEGRSTTRFNAYNSNVSWLGYSTSKRGVVLWSDRGSTVINSTFTNNYIGLFLYKSRDTTIRDSSFSFSKSTGLDSSDECINLTFDNNTAHSNWVGIVLGGNSYNCLLKDCIVYNSSWNGIWLSESSHDNIIQDCLSYNNGHSGVDLHTNVDNTTVENCIAHGNENGIYIHNEGCENNTVIDCTSYNNNVRGFFLDSVSNNTLDNCTSYGNPMGMRIRYINNSTFKSCNFSDTVQIYDGDNNNNLFSNCSVNHYELYSGNNSIQDPTNKIFTIGINGGYGFEAIVVEFSDTRTFKLDGDAGNHTSTTLAGPGTYTIEVEGTVTDTISPTTNTAVMPAPNESGWNTVTPVVVTFFRSDIGSSISYTNYSKMSETGPWTMVTTSAVTGHDAENVTAISESGFNVTLSDVGITEIWFYSVDTNSNVETTKTVTVKIDTTPTEQEHPDWWGYYVGSGEGTWGRTTTEAKTGNYSAFLKGTAYEADYINLGLIAGKSNGYSGPDAYTAVPNTTYTLSFWLKGDFTKIGVHAMTWNTEDGASGRNWGTTSIGRITPTETWTRYEGTFTTPADAKKFVVMFKAEGDSTQENLGTIYVDDVDVNVGEGNLMMNPGVEDTDFCALSGTVTTNTSQGETGLANATVTLTTVEGTEINTIQTDSTGRYEFTDVSPGNYNINATKRSYWPDSDPVTVTTEAPETADIELSQKGDYNTNSEPADAGDLAMMADATAAGTSDVTYDLDGDGNPADEADLTLLKDVSVGVAELE